MVGRKQEVKELNELYNSNKSQLVAIYGRRRIGKTYLVDETFKGRITFRHAGLSPAEADSKGMLKSQLEHFQYSLKLQGIKADKAPNSWFEAFYMLEEYLESIDDGRRQLIFLDELPWLDTPKSRFMIAFEGFWNTWGCHRDNLMVIVCGSANSWILDKLINNHGGLYNRVTYEIKLAPFTLSECEDYYLANNIKLSRYDIVQSYMVFGGVPYYMGYVKAGKSMEQNIEEIFFSKNPKLRDEYNRLFSSIFSNPEAMKNIVKFLYTKNSGYTRSEIIDNTDTCDGGTFSQIINALISSDFVTKYTPFGKGMKAHYKLTDPFCLFYLHFVDGRKHWDTSTQQVVTWRGIAFENICFNHIDQIKSTLGISGVITDQSAWSKRGDDDKGTQIDLLISRKDNVVNMCEIKYYGDDFTVNKDYYRILLRRQELLSQQIPKKTTIHTTLITTFGLTYNEYSTVFSKVITMDDLFKDR